MIIRDLFFESGSTEATKIKKILQRYVIYISDQITVPYLYTETGNRRLNIVDGMFSLDLQATNLTWSDSTATSVFQNCPVIHCGN
jgi:hypothetical protein